MHTTRTEASAGSAADGWPEVVIELTEKAHKSIDWGHTTAEKVNDAVKMYNGREAFRKYSWIKNKAITNTAGNFRGMVINKQARMAYDVTVKNADKLEKIGKALFLAGIAIEIAKNANKIKLRPKTTEDVQAILLVPSMAILKVVGGVVPLAAHWIAAAMEYRCGVFGVCENVQAIKDTDALIQSSYEQIMNPDEVRLYINTHLVL